MRKLCSDEPYLLSGPRQSTQAHSRDQERARRKRKKGQGWRGGSRARTQGEKPQLLQPPSLSPTDCWPHSGDPGHQLALPVGQGEWSWAPLLTGSDLAPSLKGHEA